MDFQERGIPDSALSPRYLKANSHAISFLHGLNGVADSQWALPDLVYYLLVIRIQLLKVQAFLECAELPRELFVELLILDGPLVHQFIKPVALDSLECQIVEPSNAVVRKIVQVGLVP